MLTPRAMPTPSAMSTTPATLQNNNHTSHPSKTPPHKPPLQNPTAHFEYVQHLTAAKTELLMIANAIQTTLHLLVKGANRPTWPLLTHSQSKNVSRTPLIV